MQRQLLIGDESFSSWSLRGFLLLDRFGLAAEIRLLGLYDGTLADDLATSPPARFVPVLRLEDGTVVGDTLAIAETLIERYPDIRFLPEEPEARALSRWLVAEMHSGFTALRGDCPMNLRHAWEGFSASDAVLADVARIEHLWATAWDRFGSDDSPWLFGDYSVADAFFAPVAARIATYKLPVSARSADYVAAHLGDLSFRRWRARGQARTYAEPPYDLGLPTLPWPGPPPLAARAVEDGPAENTVCPYSGKPVSHYLALDGRTFGFCNAFCRDKTVADPEAWPAFAALL